VEHGAIYVCQPACYQYPKLISASVLVEGIITMALGLAAFYFLPGPAEKTKFLNERERMIAIQRLMKDGDEGNTAVC
jgi:hypothetical protein